MSKSTIYVANTNAQAVAVGGTIGLGSTVRRFGCAIALTGNTIAIDEVGYYDVNVSVTAESTAIGNVTVTLLNSGVPIVGATATEYASVADTPVNLSFDSVVRVFCGANAGALTLVLSGTASNVTNVAVVVNKL